MVCEALIECTSEWRTRERRGNGQREPSVVNVNAFDRVERCLESVFQLDAGVEGFGESLDVALVVTLAKFPDSPLEAPSCVGAAREDRLILRNCCQRPRRPGTL